jgi:hypothetical protein
MLCGSELLWGARHRFFFVLRRASSLFSPNLRSIKLSKIGPNRKYHGSQQTVFNANHGNTQLASQKNNLLKKYGGQI